MRCEHWTALVFPPSPRHMAGIPGQALPPPVKVNRLPKITLNILCSQHRLGICRGEKKCEVYEDKKSEKGYKEVYHI